MAVNAGDGPATVEAVEGHQPDATPATIARLLSERKLLQRQLDKANSRTEVVVAAVEAYLADRQPPFHNAPLFDHEVGDGEPQAVHVTFADSQAGKCVGDDGLDQLRGYVAQWTKKTIAYVKARRTVGPVERLVIHLMGDLIENCGMFPTQVYELDAANRGDLVIVQVLTVVDLLTEALVELDSLQVPIMVTSAPGNHGRRQAVKTMGSAPSDNLDTLIALILQRLCRHLEVSWDVDIDAWYTATDSYGYRVVTTHGDAIPGKGTQPAFERWVLNHEATGTWGKADAVLLAHRHHRFTLDIAGIELIQVGAMDPGSPWFHRMTGKAAAPSQEILSISASQGIHAREALSFTIRRPRSTT